MLKNKKGLTLVEVMVAAAIMMIVALAMSNWMFQQSNQQKSLTAKATFNSLVNATQNAAESAKTLNVSAEAMQSGGGGAQAGAQSQ
jgi:type II secretory pathway pseudopilin PulG